jgi:hypothetical protein
LLALVRSPHAIPYRDDWGRCLDSARHDNEAGLAQSQNMKPKGDGLTVTELQKQIASVEGFRISFERFGSADTPIEPYPYDVMAPSKWRISDWKRVRLASYIGIFKAVQVYRGDDTPIKGDIKLVTLRDSYYEARYGTLEPEERPLMSELDVHRERKGKAGKS